MFVSELCAAPRLGKEVINAVQDSYQNRMSVNDIEELGSNLSRKIWQKITMIDQRAPAPRPVVS